MRAILQASGTTGVLREVLERCVPDLADYQNVAYAQGYATRVLRVAAIERERTGSDATPIAEAYARGLHKLMAYKDEYEVARLYLDPAERARIAAEFGPGAKVRVLLHPPLLRALGVDRKLRLGPWIFPAFRGLRALRGLRGSVLDPFGHTEVRRVERALAGEYDALVAQALELLSRETSAARRRDRRASRRRARLRADQAAQRGAVPRARGRAAARPAGAVDPRGAGCRRRGAHATLSAVRSPKPSTSSSAVTTAGSKCEPLPARSSSAASSGVRAGE